MKHSEIFKKYCDIYGLKCEKVARGEGGIYLKMGNESLKLTKEMLLAISGLEEAYFLNVYDDFKVDNNDGINICIDVVWDNNRKYAQQISANYYSNKEKLFRYEYSYLDLAA